MPLNKSLFERMIKWIFLSSLVGILGGLSSSLFLTLLNWASSLRILNPFLIWFLPIAGLLTAIIYHRFGSEAVKGTGLIFEEIHNPKKTLPIAIIPLVLIGTILTHLTGGSAGREGTAVQMSATLADRVSKFFRFHNKGGRIVLLMAGISAGFGSALGTPFAGAIFGMEVISGFKNRYRVFPMCLTASYVAFAVTRLLNIPHSHFLKITLPNFNFSVFISLIISGIIFGLMAFLFVRLTHFTESLFKKIIPNHFFIPIIGGIFLCLFYYLEGSYRFTGLGFPVIQESFFKISSFSSPILKTLFTSLTIGSGFKGGEFVPLVFIGSTLGSALGAFLPLSFSLLAALGFVSVFAGASKTPLACALMAAEIFGPQVFFYALITTYLSYFFSGNSSIYNKV